MLNTFKYYFEKYYFIETIKKYYTPLGVSQQTVNNTLVVGTSIGDIDCISPLPISAGILLIAFWGLYATFKSVSDRNRPPQVIIQLAGIFGLYRYQHYLVVVDMNDPSGGLLRQLFAGDVYRNFRSVNVNFNGILYFGLVPLPILPLIYTDIVTVRNRGPTIYTVLMTSIICPNRTQWSYLESYHNIKVHSGYGISTVVLSPYEMHPDAYD